MHFYELHEGDNDVFADILLARDTEMEPDEFFELVQQIRRRVQASYEHDTLVEAIADELERDHEFVTVSDDRLTAAVNVSKFDDDNFLADLEAEAESDEYDDDDDDEGDGTDTGEDGQDGRRGEFRSLLVDLERNPDLRTH